MRRALKAALLAAACVAGLPMLMTGCDSNDDDGDGVGPVTATEGSLLAIDAGSGTAVWTTRPGGTFMGSPAVAHGLVSVQGGDGVLRAFEATSGREVWRFSGAATGIVLSPPTLVGDIIVAHDHAPGRDVLFALDARTGVERWRFEAVDSLGYAFAASEATLFVPAHSRSEGHGSLVALDIASGQQRWMRPITRGAATRPAVGGGAVVIGGWDGVVHAFDVENGSERWNAQMDSTLLRELAIDGDGVYVTMTEMRYPDELSHVVALDAANGQVRWRFTIRGGKGWPKESTLYPVFAAGLVVVFGDGAQVQALEVATGAPRWAYDTGTRTDAMLAASGGTVYVGGLQRLTALDAASGAERWATTLPTDGTGLFATPGDGTIYVSAPGRSPPSHD